MSEASESATIAYVRFVLSETKMSPTALAKAAGISATTLTRPLNNSEHKFNLSTTTIEKLAAASGISPAPFFNNSDSASQYLSTLYDKGIYNEERWGAGSDTNEPIDHIAVVGSVALGRWMERGTSEGWMPYSLPIRLTSFKLRDCFAMLVGDFHVSPAADKDDFLLCVRTSAYESKFIHPELVIVERQSPDRRLVELTALRLVEAKTGWLLSTLDRRPGSKAQHELAQLPGDDDLRIVGIVQMAARQPILR